jgi:hypothetical protein
MPLHKNKEITPAEALQLDLCAECGRDLTELDVDAEIARHWPLPPQTDRSGDEARRRIALMRDYSDRRKAHARLA